MPGRVEPWSDFADGVKQFVYTLSDAPALFPPFSMDPADSSGSEGDTLYILGRNHLSYAGSLGGPATGLPKVD